VIIIEVAGREQANVGWPATWRWCQWIAPCCRSWPC